MRIFAARACNRPIWTVPSPTASRRRAPCSWTARSGSSGAASVHARLPQSQCGIVDFEAGLAVVIFPPRSPSIGIDEPLAFFLEIALLENEMQASRRLLAVVLDEIGADRPL